jgi:hypothetical protein
MVFLQKSKRSFRLKYTSLFLVFTIALFVGILITLLLKLNAGL